MGSIGWSMGLSPLNNTCKEPHEASSKKLEKVHTTVAHSYDRYKSTINPFPNIRDWARKRDTSMPKLQPPELKKFMDKKLSSKSPPYLPFLNIMKRSKQFTLQSRLTQIDKFREYCGASISSWTLCWCDTRERDYIACDHFISVLPVYHDLHDRMPVLSCRMEQWTKRWRSTLAWWWVLSSWPWNHW